MDTRSVETERVGGTWNLTVRSRENGGKCVLDTRAPFANTFGATRTVRRTRFLVFALLLLKRSFVEGIFLTVCNLSERISRRGESVEGNEI